MAAIVRIPGEALIPGATEIPFASNVSEVFWHAWIPANHLSIEPHQLHIWRVDLHPSPQAAGIEREMLSPAETDRMEKFQFEPDRYRFIVSHCALRIILSRYLDIAPQQVQYQYTDKGKPSLVPATGLFFNLAHSGELALVAVGLHSQIGVDVEFIRMVDDLDQLAKSCFSQSEFQAFQQTPAALKQRVFFNGWTRKEAYIKAVGDGLSIPLDQFDVSMLPEESPMLLSIASHPDEVNQWSMQDIPVGDDYAACIAIKTRPVNVFYLSFFEY